MEFSALENLLMEEGKKADAEITSKLRIKRGGKYHTLDVKFKKISYGKYTFLRKAATKTKKGMPDFDYDKYRVSVIVECLLDPCVSKSALMESLGVVSPEQCLAKLFFAGEIVELCDLILEESGFETDPFRDSVSSDEECPED